MAVLQCEICGGKLIGKPGGIFECDSCGMEYSTEWARAKVQEIRGTVRVDGPVEVHGSVKVEGGASVESLLKRGNIFLEDRDWNKANELFQQVLSIDPENAEGYLGTVMADLRLPDWDTFARRYTLAPSTLCGSKSLSRARQFAAGALKARFEKLEANRDQLVETYKKDLAKQRAKVTRKSIISVGDNFCLAAIKTDGTVLTNNDRIQEIVKDWQKLVSISIGGRCIAGLRLDGSVIIGKFVQSDEDSDKFRALEQLDDVVQISCGNDHVVALRKNGTVVAVGNNSKGQCNVEDWTGITAISVPCPSPYNEYTYTMGLRTDGTVTIAGTSTAIRDGVREWTDIMAISAGAVHAAGLRADGTVVAVGEQNDGRCEVGDWTDIVAIYAGYLNTIGLRSDGTLSATKLHTKNYNNAESRVDAWTDIVAVDTGYLYTVGVRKDGCLVTAGTVGDNNVHQWKLFNNWQALEQEREAARAEAQKKREAAKAEAQKKREALLTQKISLQTELSNVRGLFSGNRRRELETRLAQIEKEMNAL